MVFETLDTARWQDLDEAHFLHPFTDYLELRNEGARVVTRAEGVYVWDTDGKRIIDGLAGLGCVTIGYGRPELANAAAEQLRELSFCQSFFKTTNRAAITLARELTLLLPEGLNHVFFQSSGSEANETAIRLALRHWRLKGQPQRRVIISREAAYHGSTMMTASLSGIPPMHQAGGDLPLSNIVHIKAPHHYLNGPNLTEEKFGSVAARWLEDAILHAGADKVAAFIAEPVQGAGGAIIPPATYWPEVQRICRKYDVLLVIDEVVSGFGRTGSWFGCDTYAIKPDIMQLGKGMTSGYAPLSATIVSDRVAEVLIGSGGEWYHGFTFSGHPMCCAVALENLRVLREEQIVERAAADLVPHFKMHVEALANHPLVGDVRSVGLFAGIQLVKDRESREFFPEELKVGEKCSADALQRGLALRAVKDTMVLMPPLVIGRDEIDTVFSITRQSLDATARTFGVLG